MDEKERIEVMRACVNSLMLLGVCLPVAAQNWEAGGAAGFGFYHSVAIEGPGASGSAGFGPRFVLSAMAGKSLAEHLAIEGRYIYQDGDLQILGRGEEANLDGDSSALSGELVYSLLGRRASLRPYFAAGGGVRVYRGTQNPAPDEPLMDLALLHHATQAVGLVSFGGGVKWHFAEHWWVRLDLRDYVTPFPTQVISPAVGLRLNGRLHDFVPMLGLSWGR
jgi:Outer membrane protein beta-barrel domain